MFESITRKFGSVVDRLRGAKYITEEDFNSSLREIRIAMLEADVSLPIIKDFIDKIKNKVIGEEVIKKVEPGQMIVKIINDELLYLLGEGSCELNFESKKPFTILVCGLQGAGKTTSVGKMALRFKKKYNKKVFLVSLDIYRPAAKKQLEVLANQAKVDSLEIKENEKPLDIVERAKEQIKNNDYDIVIYDTAGRLSIDETLMNELKELNNSINPDEKLLVADSLMGQESVNIANEFNKSIDLTGIILTRLDGDGRGGSALSMKIATGCPIKYMSLGEKLDQFDEFHPERIASRILDMGDIVSFVEKAQDVISEEEATKLEERIRKGEFNLDDFLNQLKNLKKLGGFTKMLSFLPGAGKLKDFMNTKGFDDNAFKKQEAIISSMTKLERYHPEILNSSRKFRIVRGSGTDIQSVNSLLKKFKDIKNTIDRVGKMSKDDLKNMMNQLGNIKGSDFDNF